MSKFDINRIGRITGSVCTPLFPKKSAEKGIISLAKDLATQIYFNTELDEVSTWQMEHGNNFEPEAFYYYQERYDKSAEYKPIFVYRDAWGGSGDCLGQYSGADFKCPTTLTNWLDYLHDGISDKEYNQAQMYMFLYGREKWNVCAYLAETEKMTNYGLTYPVPHDKRMIINTVEVSLEWQDKLYAATPKVIELRDFYYNKLVQSFGPIEILNK